MSRRGEEKWLSAFALDRVAAQIPMQEVRVTRGGKTALADAPVPTAGGLRFGEVRSNPRDALYPSSSRGQEGHQNQPVST